MWAQTQHAWVRWAGAVGAILLGSMGLYGLYRWAEPSPQELFAPPTPPNAGPALVLRDVPFVSVLDGVVNWSLHADRIEVYSIPGVSLNSGVESANIVGIREGKLYPVQKQPSPHPPSATPLEPKTPPLILFSADRGHYSVQPSASLPQSLQLRYSVRWQLLLSGNVQVRLPKGEKFRAPEVTLVEIAPRPFGTPQLRMFCNKGAQLLYKTAQMKVGLLRYDPQSRTAECLQGAQCTLLSKTGPIQTLLSPSAYWSLADQTLRFPEAVSGTWQGIHFSSQNVALNLANQFLLGVNGASITALPEAIRALKPSNSPSVALSQPTPSSKVKPMPIRIVRPGVATSALALLTVAAVAAPPSAPKATPQEKKEPFTLIIKGPWSDSAKTSTRTAHDFIYKEKDFTLSGQDLVWNYKTDQIDATGHLTYDSSQYAGSCDRAHLDNKAHQDVFEGNVVLILKPKPTASPMPPKANGASSNTKEADASPETVRSHGVTVYCDKVVEDTQTKIFTLTGDLHAVQTFTDSDGKLIKRTLTAAYARYDDNLQQITLYPPIDFKDNQDTTAHFDNPVVIGTKEGEETLSGVGGTIVSTTSEHK